MPVHIKELNISTKIDEIDGGTTPNHSSTSGTADMEDLIKTCVEQVLQILKQRKER